MQAERAQRAHRMELWMKATASMAPAGEALSASRASRLQKAAMV